MPETVPKKQLPNRFFKEGNEYWKLRNDWTNPKKFTPEELLEEALSYIAWAANNPIVVEKAFGTGFIHQNKMPRALTFSGFCVYANLSRTTLTEYEGRIEYAPNLTHIRNLFFAQKFEGAASGIFDSNIIARELGLSDKQEVASSIQINIALPGEPSNNHRLTAGKILNIDSYQAKDPLKNAQEVPF